MTSAKRIPPDVDRIRGAHGEATALRSTILFTLIYQSTLLKMMILDDAGAERRSVRCTERAARLTIVQGHGCFRR